MLTAASTDNTGRQYLPQNPDGLSPNQALMPLTSTVNGQDHLVVGGCDVTELVKQYGSPLYILDEYTLRTTCRQYRDSFQKYYGGESLVIYASKAWSCMAICAIVDSEGLGFDVVSGGELYTTLKAGVSPQKIYFHGNNKSREELNFALDQGVTIIVDNFFELELLKALTGDRQTTAKIILRLTPGIECHTHEYIRTGHLDSKFGFDPNQIEAAFALVSQAEFLNCIGLHAHIGSQIFEQQPHKDLGDVLAGWYKKAADYGLNPEILNLGGGLGIRYTESDDPPSIEAWSQNVAQSLEAACRSHGIALPKLIVEPGRSLVGSACITAYTVGSRKVVPEIRTYVSVDGGMSDNPRPITYQSLYRAVIANRLSAPCEETVTVAGKHCESGDVVIKDAQLPTPQPGDILVVLATGAYNYSMASNYNRIGRPAAVLVNEGEAQLIIRRETLEDLVRQDCLPERLRQG
ncbi:diaminopimelate decarboxylase [Picosynechococcus sp. PCC 11901]|uniref:diaminopimelate decarboxylase n=1 Tax=unclassified Picosynechococcus TaxID=3079910 RepID=UPI000810CA87|nr:MULTISPECIES: diaminopimelate decarboxylase [unclassified Picosynechococcus]ANV86084.1 diaminopimelate decarboxylase [Picosynechococcus sp. PCC 7117]QCS48763.1 diaminopimelate decarboxylase [Picosynechococcus sp. PCC 11901]